MNRQSTRYWFYLIKCSINLWHLPHTTSIVHQVKIFLHVPTVLLTSVILKATNQASHMCCRHPYSLAWRDQAFKIDQYVFPLNDMEYCRKYVLLVYFSGLGEATVWQQAVRKSSCRIYVAPGYINEKSL